MITVTLTNKFKGEESLHTPEELWGLSDKEWEAMSSLEQDELLRQTQETKDLWDALHQDPIESEENKLNPDEDIECYMYLNLGYEKLT